jgi:hypothetical protein
MEDEQQSGRKVLREQGEVRMWQEFMPGPHRDTGQLLRYFVGRSGGAPKQFSTPHDAFNHFQKLTGAPAFPRRPSAPEKHGPEKGPRRT